jgi:hypothetical protein
VLRQPAIKEYGNEEMPKRWKEYLKGEKRMFIKKTTSVEGVT